MKFIKKLSLLCCMAFSISILSSCTSNSTEKVETSAEENITVTHLNGETTLTKNPKVVVTFDYGALDILDNLGIEVAGLPKGSLPDIFSKYQDDKYADLGGLKEPDFEAVNAVKPDLIILGGRQASMYDKFSEIAPTVQLDINGGTYMNDFERNATLLGTIFGKENEVKEEIDKIKTKISEVKDLVLPKNITALSLMVNEGSLSSNGHKSRFGLIYNDLGFVPADSEIGDSTHGQQVSFEYIVEKNPNVIFVVDKGAAIRTGGTAETVLDNDLVKSTDAYKNNKILYLNSQVWYLVSGGFSSTNAMIDEVKAFAENF